MQEKILCVCGNEPINNLKWGETETNLIKCDNCSFYQHIDCIHPSNKNTPYICPFCQLSLFDPFLKIKYHFFIPQIIQKNSSSSINLKLYLDDTIFHMYYPQENDILLLRCLKLTEEGFCLEWPDKISVFINNNLKEVYKVDKVNDTFKRQINEEIPFKLNTNLNGKNPFNEKYRYAFGYFNLNEENTIKIKFNSIETTNDKYIISLDFINITEDINEIIKNIQFISEINKLKDLIKPNELLLEQVTFIDTFSDIDNIKIPCRGWKCYHIQCFDLKTFLNMQKNTRRYCCPICNKKVGKIYIDGIMKDIIEKNSNQYEGVLINGNYEIVEFIEKNIKVEVLNDCKSKKNSNDNNNKDNDFSIHLIDDEEENFEENSSEEEESYSYFNGKSKNNIKFKSTNNSSFYSNFKNIYD